MRGFSSAFCTLLTSYIHLTDKVTLSFFVTVAKRDPLSMEQFQQSASSYFSLAAVLAVIQSLDFELDLSWLDKVLHYLTERSWFTGVLRFFAEKSKILNDTSQTHTNVCN